ncbi:MAG TPA: peptidoglycan-binding domain-containing protein [Acidobacteriaceae bacterium]|jgi:peptidoglycan hydrolase-like protein with peptidoglycan-binding domain
MVLSRTWPILALSALLAATPAFATRTHRAATSGHLLHHKAKKHKFTPGQRQIEPERAKEIQDALIREHYLPSPASGQWDPDTEAAMQKFQADHGWQTKLTPDSRALIKLGLGPHDAAPAPGTSAPPPASAATPTDDAGRSSGSGTLASTNTIHD